jgi:hypothetical protein
MFVPQNRSNFDAHYLGTGPEIWRQTNGQVDAFVSGAGKMQQRPCIAFSTLTFLLFRDKAPVGRYRGPLLI